MLIELFQVEGINSYPDSADKLTLHEKVEYRGEYYYLATYTGSKSLQVVSFEDYQAYVNAPLIDVVVDDVSNLVEGFDDTDRKFTVTENSNSLATGSLAIVDTQFRVPFMRVDTGRTQLMPAIVKDGKFTITLNFKTSGKWVVNQALLNSELQQEAFSIEEYTFFVI